MRMELLHEAYMADDERLGEDAGRAERMKRERARRMRRGQNEEEPTHDDETV